MTREEWILSHQWRLGRQGGSVICDPAGAMENCTEEDARREAALYDFYGGFPVLESCPTSVCLRIIRMHNCHDDLVAALSAIINDCTEVLDGREPFTMALMHAIVNGRPRAALANAKAALANAEAGNRARPGTVRTELTAEEKRAIYSDKLR